MKPLVIFGAGEIAEVANYYFRKVLNHPVAAFTVDAAYLKETTFAGLPVVPFENVTVEFPPAAHGGFAALSYASMNQVRAAKVAALREAGYELVSYVSPRATIYTDVIGANCFILEDNTIQPFARIGDNVTLWSGNHIGHHARIEANVFITSHVVVSGGVTVGANSFVGVNTAIRDHVTLAPFTFVGAGGVILADTQPEGVYATEPSAQRKLKSTRMRM